MNRPKVMDLFCGAGGFSEGFRQQGFEIILGIDNWESAIKTYNHNFRLNCNQKNMLDFENSIEEIENLPDTEVIIGSPPCVSFSSSNRSGKADKSMGVRLTEGFLRIVAVKKHKPNSILEAWLMENVPNSVKYLKDSYSFKDLNLSSWARENGISQNYKAIILRGNQLITNSAEYGSPQIRKRVISGELIIKGELVVPEKIYQSPKEYLEKPVYLSLGQIKNMLPNPSTPNPSGIIRDPLYHHLTLKTNELTDHFYDTGLYQWQWEQSRFLKSNHPYMGKMSFPENENKPSRTITATNIATSREALIYESEYNRKGDGEFRTPTIREISSLMGFPITYQFMGSEGIKNKMIGNSVCPSVSRAFAKEIRIQLGLKPIDISDVEMLLDLNGIENLNSFRSKSFNNPPLRNKGARFRRHPFKDGNLTVTLSNYNIIKNTQPEGKWYTSIQYGNGKGFPIHNIEDFYFKKVEPIIFDYESGRLFIEIINKGFSKKITSSKQLQELYEQNNSYGRYRNPVELINEIRSVLENLKIPDNLYYQNSSEIFHFKKNVPLRQLLALYAINFIASKTNL